MWPDNASLNAGHTVTHPCFKSLCSLEQAVIVEMHDEIAELSNGLFLPHAELTFVEMGERWVIIADYDRYLLSSHGKVVSLRYRKGSRQRLLRVLNPLILPQVALTNYQGIRQMGINRLVAQAFLPPAAEKRLTYLMPKDGKVLNVQVDNLQWIDPREVEDEIVMDYLRRRGEQHPASKLTTKEVVEIRALVAHGTSGQALADTYHVSQPNISLIVNGLSRRTL
jgi:hypothetical protein